MVGAINISCISRIFPLESQRVSKAFASTQIHSQNGLFYPQAFLDDTPFSDRTINITINRTIHTTIDGNINSNNLNNNYNTNTLYLTPSVWPDERIQGRQQAGEDDWHGDQDVVLLRDYLPKGEAKTGRENKNTKGGFGQNVPSEH